MSKPFNGHKNWNHWNVSLWINNDEGLYNMARSYTGQRMSRRYAAQAMLDDLNASGITKTPDGAPYSLTTIRHAMEGMS